MADALPPRQPVRKTTVIAIANQKGGSAKTTTAIHLAAAIAELDKTVLLVDLDPQGHVAEGFGIAADSLPHEISDVLTGDKRITEIIIPQIRPNLDIAPSNIRLSDMELTLVNVRFREYKVQRALEPVIGRYDYIILDCPPNQGLLTVNALIAAHGVIAPMTSEYLSMLGVSLLLKTIGELRTEANPKLQVLGVIHTRHRQGTIHAREVMMRTNIELSGNVRVFEKPIHESIRFAEAMGQGKTVFELAPEIEGAVVYKQIAKEVVHATQ